MTTLPAFFLIAGSLVQQQQEQQQQRAGRRGTHRAIGKVGGRKIGWDSSSTRTVSFARSGGAKGRGGGAPVVARDCRSWRGASCGEAYTKSAWVGRYPGLRRGYVCDEPKRGFSLKIPIRIIRVYVESTFFTFLRFLNPCPVHKIQWRLCPINRTAFLCASDPGWPVFSATHDKPSACSALHPKGYNQFSRAGGVPLGGSQSIVRASCSHLPWCKEFHRACAKPSWPA